MPEHSPEPFCLAGLVEIGSAATPDTVKRTDDFDEEWLVAICRSPEDARRIVACVNFCTHIPTKTIERLLAQELGAATALKLLREWEDDGDEPGVLYCRSCGHLYSEHDDDCLLKPLVDAWKETMNENIQDEADVRREAP